MLRENGLEKAAEIGLIDKKYEDFLENSKSKVGAEEENEAEHYVLTEGPSLLKTLRDTDDERTLAVETILSKNANKKYRDLKEIKVDFDDPREGAEKMQELCKLLLPVFEILLDSRFNRIKETAEAARRGIEEFNKKLTK